MLKIGNELNEKWFMFIFDDSGKFNFFIDELICCLILFKFVLNGNFKLIILMFLYDMFCMFLMFLIFFIWFLIFDVMFLFMLLGEVLGYVVLMDSCGNLIFGSKLIFSFENEYSFVKISKNEMINIVIVFFKLNFVKKFIFFFCYVIKLFEKFLFFNSCRFVLFF